MSTASSREIEIGIITVDRTPEEIIELARHILTNWRSDELGSISTVLEADPDHPGMYVWIQIDREPQLIPPVLGYLQTSLRSLYSTKPNQLRVVCCWNPVESALQAVLNVFQTKSAQDAEEPVRAVPPSGPDWLPKGARTLSKWAEAWELIKPMVEHGDPDAAISNWLQKTHPHLPGSRGRVGKIIMAGKMGYLRRKWPKS